MVFVHKMIHLFQTMREVENDISGASTLVKRLTKSEKAFITKKLAASKGNKAHRQLFDVIAKTNSFEEDEIKELFLAANKGVNYTLIKSQLLELCLKYLVELDSTKNEYQLFQRLEAARIMGRRGLPVQGTKIAHAVLKDAEKYDLLALQFRAYEILYEIAAKTRNLDEIGDMIEGTNRAVIKLQTHNNILSVTHEANEVFFRMNATPEFQKRFEWIRTAIPETVESDSLKIKTALNHLKGFVTMVYECDYEKALPYFEENVRLMVNHPDFSEKHPKIYSTASYNVAMCLNDLNEEERFLELTEKIIAADTKSNVDDAETFGSIFILRINFLQRRNKHNEVLDLIEQHEKKILAESPLMTSGMKLAVLTNSIISYFKCAEMRKALKWSNYVLNDHFSIYHDVLCFNRILNLIIHFELGNIELLESILPNTMRFLVSHGHYSDTFKAVYDFFVEYVKDYSGKNEKTLFTKLKSTLSDIGAPVNFNMEEFHELIGEWVERKLN